MHGENEGAFHKMLRTKPNEQQPTEREADRVKKHSRTNTIQIIVQ